MIFDYKKKLYNTDDLELLAEIEGNYFDLLIESPIYKRDRFYFQTQNKPIICIEEEGICYRKFIFRLKPFKIGFSEKQYDFNENVRVSEIDYQTMINKLLENEQYNLAEKLAIRLFIPGSYLIKLNNEFSCMLKKFEKIGKKDLVNRLFKTYQEDKNAAV